MLIIALLALPLQVSGAGTGVPVVHRDSVRYRSGAIELAATLLRPEARGPTPGVVILHGSGSSDRSNPWTTAYANALAERGIAVLYPDKRGSGQSGGSWKTASMEDLAADASAGIALLRARADIDTTRIGVIGFSQGGYVASVVAATDPRCKLVVVVSGGVATLQDQMVDELVTEAAGTGTPLRAPDESTLRGLYAQAFEFAKAGRGWSAFRSLLDSARRVKPLEAPISTLPADSAHWAWAWLRRTGNFDPMVYWTKVRQPVLLFYGGHDDKVRARQSIERFWDGVGPAAPNFVVTLLQGNGHALFRADVLAFISRWVSDRGEN